jgi:hypothetical protein
MKLAQLAGPQLIKTDSYGTARVAFPNGDVFDYHLHDKATLDAIVRKYGRNAGRLMATLKRTAIEVERITSPTF